jgi:hypothetical protein
MYKSRYTNKTVKYPPTVWWFRDDFLALLGLAQKYHCV